MLDVHAPHETIHGFRDFLLHLLTITVGLLIALGLENAAEALHHRHQRQEADELIRQEIRDNQKEITGIRAAIVTEQKNLIGALEFLTARKENRPYDIRPLSLSYSQNPLSNTGWNTASATGALSLMSYEHVQRYAGAYQMQQEFVDLEKLSLMDFLQLQSYVAYKFDPEKMTPAQAEAAMPDVRRAMAHLVATDQIGQQLLVDYGTALDGKE